MSVDVLDAAMSQLERADQADEADGFPHFADPVTGEWTTSPDGDWTGGFHVGQLWLGVASGLRPDLADSAARWAQKLASRVSTDTVFRGFLFWYGVAAGARLSGDQGLRSLACRGAEGLAGSYVDAAGLLPLGSAGEEAHSVGPGEANIDGVPGGTPLLAWAAEELDEPEMRSKALSHARRHAEWLVRDDGSVVQSASFDTATGGLVRTYTHKGVSDDSTWTRAQAWALLGFAQASAVERSFDDVASAVADWWMTHLPESGVTTWDFDDPDPNAPTDTSGTAIASAALLKLAELGIGDSSGYRQCAERSVAALVENHLKADGRLVDGCYNNRIGLATNAELVWGDYFLLESCCVLGGRLSATEL
ncbi:MAG: glycoside hydrolase family 88 protein [Acidimicrobiales bacterium]